MTTTTTPTGTLDIAPELSSDKWLLACATPAAPKPRFRSVPARDLTKLREEIAKVAPTSAHVVKAFNTIFGHVLAEEDRNMDALFAGDDADAKTSVSAFIESLGLRPLDVGGLGMARWLEGAGLLVVGLARNGVANYDFTLAVRSTRQ